MKQEISKTNAQVKDEIKAVIDLKVDAVTTKLEAMMEILQALQPVD